MTVRQPEPRETAPVLAALDRPPLAREAAAGRANDPVWQAFLNAPFADEEETEEQRLVVEEGMRGPFISGEVA